MDDSPAIERAELARLRLACYLRLAKVPGEAHVVRGAAGPRLAVVLKHLTVEHVAAVPRELDGLRVEVRV